MYSPYLLLINFILLQK